MEEVYIVVLQRVRTQGTTRRASRVNHVLCAFGGSKKYEMMVESGADVGVDDQYRGATLLSSGR